MIRKLFVVLISFVFLLLLFQSQCYRVKRKAEIPDNYKGELNQLCEKALESKDVPVASILVYEGKIISEAS